MPIIPINPLISKNVEVLFCKSPTTGAKVELTGTAASITGTRFPRTITKTNNTINILAIAIRLPFISPLDFLRNILSNGFKPLNITTPHFLLGMC